MKVRQFLYRVIYIMWLYYNEEFYKEKEKKATCVRYLLNEFLKEWNLWKRSEKFSSR